MERIHMVKGAICAASGVIGSGVALAFGGWSADLTTLAICMGADFVTGVFVALHCKSQKTESGGLSSQVSFQGLLKKAMILLLVMVAHRIDVTLGVDYVKTMAVVAFIVNEAISITENAGLLGVPLPAIISKAIDILKGKTEGQENGKEDGNEKRD